MNDVHNKWNDMIESGNELLKSLGEMLCQQEQVANLSTHTPEPSRRFNSICYDDDVDEEMPGDSLIMGNEDLHTIPEKESDEFIKSSVEDLVPIPIESEDTSDSDKQCDLPFYDNSVTFSNPLFDVNDDFTSSNDESLLEEDVRRKILKFIRTLFLNLMTSDIDEIDVDVSTDIKDGYHDSEGDIIYLESLLITDTIPNLPPEDKEIQGLPWIMETLVLVVLSIIHSSFNP
uniref:Uncharacterized protein n=1 Tax=Tanacetum cinerariifolium TaxID=118510 RepID=A0A6L2KIH3_TANCI|nr:hypothetical protein [Tanacetum cinerariifolium]